MMSPAADVAFGRREDRPGSRDVRLIREHRRSAFLPIRLEPRFGGRRHGHDPPTVGRRQAEEVAKESLGRDHVGGPRHEVEIELFEPLGRLGDVGEIDHDLARGADDGSVRKRQGAVGIAELFKDRRIAIFAVWVVVFHLANAAMLPLVGQKSSDGLRDRAPIVMSACIITAQVVMVPVALAASRLAASWGRKPVFLIGFTVLPVRGLLYCLSVNPYYLVGVQLLDGIGAGIFGVVSVLVVADLTQGTGRFNLTLTGSTKGNTSWRSSPSHPTATRDLSGSASW